MSRVVPDGSCRPADFVAIISALKYYLDHWFSGNKFPLSFDDYRDAEELLGAMFSGCQDSPNQETGLNWFSDLCVLGIGTDILSEMIGLGKLKAPPRSFEEMGLIFRNYGDWIKELYTSPSAVTATIEELSELRSFIEIFYRKTNTDRHVELYGH